MATVFLARDLKHGRLVALKVLAPELRSSQTHSSGAGTAWRWTERYSAIPITRR